MNKTTNQIEQDLKEILRYGILSRGVRIKVMSPSYIEVSWIEGLSSSEGSRFFQYVGLLTTALCLKKVSSPEIVDNRVRILLWLED